jgi:peptide/nickel transport system ATP-binding protein
MNDANLLELQDLSVHAGATPLLRGVSFALAAGRSLTVLGESGAGKSLMAQAIMGTLPSALAAGGAVTVCGQESPARDQHARQSLWGHRLASLPQEPTVALDPLMRVWRQAADVYCYVRGMTAQQAHAASLAALGEAGLEAAAKRYPWQLSGGMAQRAAACVALAGGARILLVDEPTKGLDAHWRAKTVELLRRTLQEGGCVVAITHDLELAQALGGDVMVLREGQVVEQGPASEVLTTPAHPFTRRLLAADPARWSSWPRRAASGVVVEAQGLAKSRGGRLLFENVELALRRGDRLVLQGQSGSGKTTLGNILCGVLTPDRGSVALATGLARTARQKLYQDPALAFPPRVPLETTLRDAAALHGCPWLAMQDRLERLKVGGAMLRRRPSQVSGGELQRIALARVLAARPALLVADEPTSRLDPITQRQALEELVQAADESDAALAFVTHDDGIARALGTQVLRIGE